MKKMILVVVSALFITILFTTCSSLRSIIVEPKVSVRTVELAGLNFSGMEMIVHLDVENPNGFDLPFPKIDWELFINDSSFVNGYIGNGNSIRRRRTTPVPVSFSITYEDLYKSLSSLFRNDEIAYDVKLGLVFPLPLIQEKTFNLEFSGNIPMVKIPNITPRSVSVAKIDFNGVELVGSFDVENLNAFPIPFPNLSWEYAAAGIPIMASVVNADRELGANEVSSVDVSVNVNYADLFRQIPAYANASEVPALFRINSGFALPAAEETKNIFDLAAALPVLRMPEFSVSGINRVSLDRLRFEFVVNFEINNPNPFAMNVARLNYNFRVNNNTWSQGLFQDPPVVRANARTILPLTVVIESASMVQGLMEIISRGTSVNYSCTGDLKLTSDFPGLPEIDIPVNLSGSTRIRG